MLLSTLLMSVFCLTACGQAKITKPKSVSSSSKVVESTMQQIKEKKKLAYDDKLSEKCVKGFMTAYFEYDSANSRISETKEFCTLEVQKNLGLKETKNDIEMSSSIDNLSIYKSNVDEKQYLVLVETSINSNQVTPQLVKIVVDNQDGTYLVSDVKFPVMK